MAFGLKEAFAIGSLVLPFFGGKLEDRLTDEATGKFSTSGDGLMSKLFGVGEGMFWEFLAQCAGTVGAVLIIGSAAGVAVMGILKIDFIWYVKNISLLALMGYLAGAATYILMQ